MGALSAASRPPSPQPLFRKAGVGLFLQATDRAPMSGHILVIDQGTTSTRAIVFGPDATPIASEQQEFRQIFPKPGWVEHDPEDIWRSTLATAREALAKADLAPAALAGLGIANQRETTLVGTRATGRAIHNAIVWQDRRTAPLCARLRDAGHEAMI